MYFRARRENCAELTFRRRQRRVRRPVSLSFRGPTPGNAASATRVAASSRRPRPASVGKDDVRGTSSCPACSLRQIRGRSNSSASAPSSSGGAPGGPLRRLGRAARSGTGCGDGCAAHRPPARATTKRELGTGPGDADVEQPRSSLRPHGRRVLDRHRSRRPADQEYGIPFQPLGRVQRGQRDACTVGACCTAARSSSSAAKSRRPASGCTAASPSATCTSAASRFPPARAPHPPGGGASAASHRRRARRGRRRPAAGRHRPHGRRRAASPSPPVPRPFEEPLAARST